MISMIKLFLLWFAVWVILCWPPEARDIITAVMVSLFVSYMTGDLILRPQGASGGKRASTAGFLRALWFLYYAAVFIWECFKANIDVAYRVLHPALPIRPGTVKVKVGLKSDIGLTFLANSITLTPGTTSVDVDKEGGYLYVHCLCVKSDAGRLPVVARFERILSKIFE
jgi:multicomponent Na+:H+ antiporter subunit E